MNGAEISDDTKEKSEIEMNLEYVIDFINTNTLHNQINFSN